MYACKQCGTGNPLDSSFCKKCGSALPTDELAGARQKLSEMLDEGNSLFTEGHTDEAMLIAEAAVTANPSSHLAHSLKGLCHERVGQIAEALECYETAVGLNPDSSLDKVKVAALRNRLATRATESTLPSRRNAAMIGAAATVLVLVAGALTAIGMSGHRDHGNVAMNTPSQTSFINPQAQAPAQQPGPLTQQAPGTQPGQTSSGAQGQTQQGGTPPASGGAQPLSDPGPALPRLGGTQLPTPYLGDGQVDAPVDPPLRIQPTGPIGSGIGAGSTSTDRPTDPPPAPLNNPPSGTSTAAAPTKPADEQGYIHIEMAPKAPQLPGGGSAVPDSNGMTAVLKVAQEEFQLGKYDLAAAKYQQVANMGGNSPHLQQRIGDCFRNLGNTDRARAAYNRAITMYQAQIKQGASVSDNQRGLDTCETALKVLGG